MKEMVPAPGVELGTNTLQVNFTLISNIKNQ